MNSLIQLPYPIANDHETFPPRCFHERPKLFDRAIVIRNELQHRLYAIQRQSANIRKHPFNELGRKILRSVFEPNKKRSMTECTFQCTRICSACCCCILNSGGLSIKVAGNTVSACPTQIVRKGHTQSRWVSLSCTRTFQIGPLQQIERKLRVLYENTVVDPCRQRLERRASINRPNSLDKVVENPSS